MKYAWEECTCIWWAILYQDKYFTKLNIQVHNILFILGDLLYLSVIQLEKIIMKDAIKVASVIIFAILFQSIFCFKKALHWGNLKKKKRLK